MPSDDDRSELARTRRTIRRIGALLAFTVATTGSVLQEPPGDPMLALLQAGFGGYLVLSVISQGVGLLPEPDRSTGADTAD
jgi:hypothetical protein